MNEVRVGDRMRISVELIRQMAEEPDFSLPVVELVDVRVEADGCKVLVLKKPEDV